jgi:hypothetical protein
MHIYDADRAALLVWIWVPVHPGASRLVTRLRRNCLNAETWYPRTRRDGLGEHFGAPCSLRETKLPLSSPSLFPITVSNPLKKLIQSARRCSIRNTGVFAPQDSFYSDNSCFLSTQSQHYLGSLPIVCTTN